jgi:hypothetical protein
MLLLFKNNNGLHKIYVGLLNINILNMDSGITSTIFIFGVLVVVIVFDCGRHMMTSIDCLTPYTN